MKQQINYPKAHAIAFLLDLFALGSYFGFKALSNINFSINNLEAEIIVNEGDFYTFMALIVIAFHILIAIYAHTSIAKSAYKNKFLNTGIIISFFMFFFSGYFVSSFVENKLINAEYHFCGKLSYDKRYKSTHYVWRAKNKNCDTSIETRTSHKFPRFNA